MIIQWDSKRYVVIGYPPILFCVEILWAVFFPRGIWASLVLFPLFIKKRLIEMDSSCIHYMYPSPPNPKTPDIIGQSRNCWIRPSPWLSVQLVICLLMRCLRNIGQSIHCRIRPWKHCKSFILQVAEKLRAINNDWVNGFSKVVHCVDSFEKDNTFLTLLLYLNSCYKRNVVRLVERKGRWSMSHSHY